MATVRSYYEIITERGIILHPRDMEWKTVYADEFVPEMNLLGHSWKPPGQEEYEDNQYGSMATWQAGGAEALKILAQEKLGPDSPPFQFKSRQKHSVKQQREAQLLLDFVGGPAPFNATKGASRVQPAADAKSIISRITSRVCRSSYDVNEHALMS